MKTQREEKREVFTEEASLALYNAIHPLVMNDIKKEDRDQLTHSAYVLIGIHESHESLATHQYKIFSPDMVRLNNLMHAAKKENDMPSATQLVLDLGAPNILLKILDGEAGEAVAKVGNQAMGIIQGARELSDF